MIPGISDASIWRGLIEGGSSAILLGIVLLVITPRIIALFKDQTRVFSEEMAKEREAHREETTKITDALVVLTEAIHTHTVELRVINARNDIDAVNSRR